LRADMVQRGDMLDTNDVIDVLAIDLLGVVPDDESIIVSTNRGVPAVMENNSRAGQAFRNIAGRLLGQDIPMMDIEATVSWLERISRLVRRP
jgi:septum site-determining protein MinD